MFLSFRHSTLLAFAYIVSITLSPVAAAQNFETTRIAEGVFQYRWMAHNGLFVVGGNEVLVFDPISNEASAEFANEIKRVAPGKQLAAIIYSHSDADHATGASTLVKAFNQKGVPIIAHERAVTPIRNKKDPNLPEPTITFSERMSLLAGNRKVELHYLGPSHTDNMIVAYIPDAGIAFAVDFVNNNRTGYQDLPGWHFPEFFEAIHKMLEIPFETVVFGHGPPGKRAAIQRQITYYDDLLSAVRQGFASGLTEDEVANHITLPAYADFEGYEKNLPLNARAIYRWLAANKE